MYNSQNKYSDQLILNKRILNRVHNKNTISNRKSARYTKDFMRSNITSRYKVINLKHFNQHSRIAVQSQWQSILQIMGITLFVFIIITL